jgi:hypothetical protein
VSRCRDQVYLISVVAAALQAQSPPAAPVAGAPSARAPPAPATAIGTDRRRDARNGPPAPLPLSTLPPPIPSVAPTPSITAGGSGFSATSLSHAHPPADDATVSLGQAFEAFLQDEELPVGRCPTD